LLFLVGCSASAVTDASRPSVADDGQFAVVPGDGFHADGSFDSRMTCDGAGDFSPPLIFRHVPSGTTELVLSMVDEDKISAHGDPLVHWVQWSISPTEPGLMEHTKPASAREALNDLNEATYDGPCPPTGQTHHYRFTLTALAKPLNLPYGTPARQVLAAAGPSTIATTTFIATYRH
jgi:Raf kinase inhibitor-like YbhB/YbcL family protein